MGGCSPSSNNDVEEKQIVKSAKNLSEQNEEEPIVSETFSEPESEVQIQTKAFYQNRVWFLDVQDNPKKKKSTAEWMALDDLTSTMIDIHYQELAAKETTEIEIYINDEYKVNFKKLIHFNINQSQDQRAIKRGDPNARGNRVDLWRFTNNSILPQRKILKTKGQSDGLIGCSWLGEQYKKQVLQKLNKRLRLKTVIEGVIREQSSYGLKSDQNDENIQIIQEQVLQQIEKAWFLIFQYDKISQTDIDEICLKQHSESSDEARKVILKVHTLETQLYTKLNQVQRTKDHRKVETLGPYALLLNLVLSSPPLKTLENETEIKIEDVWYENDETVTTKINVFRGLSLNQDSLELFKEKMQSSEALQFTGYISTTTDKESAEFLIQSLQEEDLIPAILDIDLIGERFTTEQNIDRTSSMAFLKGEDLSGFAIEEEILIGGGRFLVKKMSENEETGIMEIKLKELYYNWNKIKELWKEIEKLYEIKLSLNDHQDETQRGYLETQLKEGISSIKKTEWKWDQCVNLYQYYSNTQGAQSWKHQRAAMKLSFVLGINL